MIAAAAGACERYGWTWAEVRNGCPLSVLLIMLRQPGPFRPADSRYITAGERELYEWMDERGLAPGDDVSEFYEEKDTRP
jgi:hypothetical protein